MSLKCLKIAKTDVLGGVRQFLDVLKTFLKHFISSTKQFLGILKHYMNFQPYSRIAEYNPKTQFGHVFREFVDNCLRKK